MKSESNPYTIVSMYRHSFDTVASLGFDKQEMYSALGLDLDQLPAEHRLNPIVWGDKVWQVLTKYVSEDEISFRIMDRFRMGVFGVAGYVIVNSPNLISAFENFVRYTTLHTNLYTIRVEQGDSVKLIIERSLPWQYADRFNIEMYVLGFTLNILKLLPGRQLPLEVHLESPPPKSMQFYNDIFGEKTSFFFNEKQNLIIYDKALSEMPILNANEQLYVLFDKMAADSLQQISDEGVMARQVKEELIKRLKGNLPGIDVISAQLNMSVRNLQLKLKQENKSFRELTDEVRRDIAITHLRTKALNISEIAYLLGFSGVSSFSSAFKKWTGKSPSAFL
jgi:AraC-like DNA-binding protein